MIQYSKYTEYDKRQILELYLNILKVFNEKQVKQYKGFLPFNLKFYNAKVKSIKNLDFNSIQLRKIRDGIYRFYLNDDEIFNGTQKVIDRKIEREYPIINSGLHFFDFSISPFKELNTTDEQYNNQEVSYEELMNKKSYLDIDYFYVHEKLYLNETIKTNITEYGRINDLELKTIDLIDNFEVKLINKNIDDVGPIKLFIMSLYKRKVYLYSLDIGELFERIEEFDLKYDRIIHNELNVFDKELNDLIWVLEIQKTGETNFNLFGTSNLTLIDSKSIDELINQKLKVSDRIEISYRFSNKYSISEDDGFIFVMPYIYSYKNISMFNPNFLETTQNLKLINSVNGKTF